MRSALRASSLLAWTIWLGIAFAAAMGLRQYRVDNRLADWIPAAETRGSFASYVVVGFPASLATPETISDALRACPTIAMCIDPATVEAFGPLRGISPQDFVVSRDGDFVGVFCFPTASATDEAFVQDVRNTLAKTLGPRAAEVSVGGPAVFHLELNAWSQRRLPLIVASLTVLGAVLLAWVTGRARAALAAVAGLVLSQLVLIGGLSWLAVPMDMSLSVVPPMMLSLGFSYAAHRATRPGIVWALVLCGWTTAAGIACFAVTDLAPIRNFAIAGVIGLGLAWLAVVTLVPPPDGRPPRPGVLTRLGRRLSVGMVEHRPGTICIAAVLLSIGAIPAAAFLRFETDPLRYFPSSAAIAGDFHTLDARLTGMLPFQLVVSGDCPVATILGDTPGIRKTLDISEFVDAPDRVYWCLAANDSLPALISARPAWEARAAECGSTVTWTGVAAQLAGVSRTVKRIAMFSLPLMVLLAAIVTGLLTRSWLFALLGAWVNALPIFALVVLAVVTGWPLGLPALMIGAIAVGMAIDDTIHIAAGLAHGDSLRRVLVRCWRPCAGSTFVAASCLLLFGAAPFRPTAQFGLLLSFAAVAALVADLLVLPAAQRLLFHTTGSRP